MLAERGGKALWQLALPTFSPEELHIRRIAKAMNVEWSKLE